VSLFAGGVYLYDEYSNRSSNTGSNADYSKVYQSDNSHVWNKAESNNIENSMKEIEIPSDEIFQRPQDFFRELWQDYSDHYMFIKGSGVHRVAGMFQVYINGDKADVSYESLGDSGEYPNLKVKKNGTNTWLVGQDIKFQVFENRIIVYGFGGDKETTCYKWFLGC
jgi:hypothetical protein